VTEDFDVDGLDFSPAISATGADPDDATTARGPSSAGRPRRRGRRATWRRRLAGAVVLLAALIGMGGAYALFATSSGANSATSADTDAAAGQQLYENSCITCHGQNLQGVQDRGPSLVGVGSAAVYFQVSTGRMPASGQGAENNRKTAKFTDQQIQQLEAYVQAHGGGPQTPADSEDLRKSSLSQGEGGELFRLNCASCHGFSGAGAPLSAGKSAPGLKDATDKQLYTAMLTGPENMPVFGDNQLTSDQKRAIIDYIQTLKASKDPGGNGIDRIGPVSEGLVIWVIGIGAVVIAILWIGAKSR
jgi:ubiquinol-cytochrome c reductase cytochrome c subunit